MVREAGVNEKGRLMMRLNKGDIKAAVDRNILVYDSKAKVGVLTKALSTYMCEVARHNGDTLLHTLYVGSEIVLDEFKDEEFWGEKIYLGSLKIEVDERLDLTGELTKYFDEIGANVKEGDIHLMVAKGYQLPLIWSESAIEVHIKERQDILLGSC